MKLTLRPEWRLWPLASFLGILDLKTGVIVALIFALLNKVAGIYGLIAVLTGSGGTFPQISLYVYSALALAGLIWGLKVIKAEDPKYTLYFAHLFFADHVLSTAWTIFFGVVWWVYTPHDGRRQANSRAQEEMMHDVQHVDGVHMTEEERANAAMTIWNKEKGTAAIVIASSWLAKIYFALLLYSYAVHLRKGSYRTLPLSRPNGHSSTPSTGSQYYTSLPEIEEEDVENLYRPTHRSSRSASGMGKSQHKSTPSFDVVSAPNRSRRSRPGSGNHSSTSKTVLSDLDIDDEVLFDEAAHRSKMHPKMGTDETESSPSDEW